MRKKLKFIKEPDSKWYIDLPDWEGSKADLEMVAGADDLLDMLAQGKNEVTLSALIEDIPNSGLCVFTTHEDSFDEFKLQIMKSDDGGATYTALRPKKPSFDVWLCNVTKYVFGKFPDRIYIN